MRCWRCNAQSSGYKCYACNRTKDRAYEERIERLKAAHDKREPFEFLVKKEYGPRMTGQQPRWKRIKFKDLRLPVSVIAAKYGLSYSWTWRVVQNMVKNG